MDALPSRADTLYADETTLSVKLLWIREVKSLLFCAADSCYSILVRR